MRQNFSVQVYKQHYIVISPFVFKLAYTETPILRHQVAFTQVVTYRIGQADARALKMHPFLKRLWGMGKIGIS